MHDFRVYPPPQDVTVRYEGQPKCGTCKHYAVLYKTPTGRPKKNVHGQCNAVVQLIKPIAYEVTITKKAVWADTDAHGCPCYAR